MGESTALLLASFAAASWVSEALPAAPVVNIWTPSGADARIVNVLASICRRGLVLTEPSVAELLRLPPGFSPTLLLRPTHPRTLATWLAAVTSCDAQILRAGALLRLRCPLAIFSRERIDGVGLSVPLGPADSWRPLSAHEKDDLADQFQGRFLSFRLHRHRHVETSSFDVTDCAPELRPLAAALGATLEGAPCIAKPPDRRSCICG